MRIYYEIECAQIAAFWKDTQDYAQREVISVDKMASFLSVCQRLGINTELVQMEDEDVRILRDIRPT